MAFFSRTPAKKPDPRKPAAGGVAPQTPGGVPARPVSARELAAQVQDKRQGESRNIEPTGENTVTGVSVIEWPNTPSAMEVTTANPGLCAVLENATLLYAGGQTIPARLLLEEGVQNDYDAAQSPLAWLALFDVLQRVADRVAFEQLALQYVVQFELSAPAWDETAKSPLSPKAVVGGYVPITGKLSVASLPQIENLKRTIAKNIPGSKLDLASVTGFDDAGARLLADTLATARKHRFALVLQRPEKLRSALDAAVKNGGDGNEGAWLLSLELLQFMHDQTAFDDRAVEYAIAFELSPPSWEPPPRLDVDPPLAVTGARPESDDRGEVADVDMLSLNGVMAGSITPQLAQLHEFAQRKAVVPIDMSAIERIDFVAAGALVNAINRLETQRKSIQFVGVSPIIRAMLLLIGVSPRHFVKKG